MSTQNLIDLSTLPAPSVIESLSFETILAGCKTDFVTLYPDAATTVDMESEPIVKLLQVMAYREVALRARYNDEARALLLAFATGTDLDHIGTTYYQEARLVVTPADEDAIPPVAAAMESDDAYRYRLALKPESYSVAGPRGAYEFHARSADGQIKSVSVSSPIQGTTQVHVLTHTGNGIPSAELIATVSTALNSESLRPLSEEVLVSAPTVIEYDLTVALTLFAGPSTELVTAAVQSALAQFASSHHMLETDIVLSAIDAAAHVTGVKKVVIVSPAADIECAPGEAAYCTGVTVTIAAIE